MSNDLAQTATQLLAGPEKVYAGAADAGLEIVFALHCARGGLPPVQPRSEQASGSYGDICLRALIV